MTKNLEKLEDSLLDALDFLEDLELTLTKFRLKARLETARKALED